MFEKGKWQNWLNALIALVKEHRILIAIVFFSLILRMLWIKIPVHGDEGEAGYNAMMWARGLTPYVSRGMDKPPLMYLLYLIPIRLFGNDIIPIRILNDILFLSSIIPLYLIATDWSGKRTGLFSALFYGIFMSVPAIEGPYALASSLSLPFLIFSVYFANDYSRVNKWWLLLISGLFASMVSLIYQQWAAIFILLLIIVLISRRSFQKLNYGDKRFLFRNSVAGLSILIVGIIIPISLFAVYFWIHGALYDLIYNTVIKFLGHDLEFATTRFGPFDWTLLTLVEGLPLWLLSMYGILVCILRLNRTYSYLLGWAFISLVLLLVEPRHFGHYILFTVPAASILSGIALSSLITDIHSTSFRERSQKAATILIIFIVLLSFVPSIFFQAKQYPNFSIDWKYNLGNTISVGVYWRAEMEGNYDIQMSIANYLRSLKVNDGEVLLHGWFPHLYWLSGLDAPSAYICTFRDWAPIPDSEYQRLVNMVKEHDFKVIVLCNNSPKDAITGSTFGGYFYIKSIGDVQIFSRNTPKGHVSYRFIENFPQALKEYDQADGTRNYLETTGNDVIIPQIRTLAVNNETMQAILQRPVPTNNSEIMNSYVIYNSVFIPQNSTLDFSTAIDPSVWNQAGDGVQFRILIQNDQGSNEIFSEYVDPKHVIDDRSWHSHQLDLSEYYGENVSISFVTNPGAAGDVAYDWAYFGDPLILIKS